MVDTDQSVGDSLPELPRELDLERDGSVVAAPECSAP
jgi:hypothetical protein